MPSASDTFCLCCYHDDLCHHRHLTVLFVCLFFGTSGVFSKETRQSQAQVTCSPFQRVVNGVTSQTLNDQTFTSFETPHLRFFAVIQN
jgi:hypothetical protein